MQDIQRLVLEFYEGLLGASCGSREELDRVCIEDGRTLTGEQQHYLAEETHDHLFCGCGVSREIMQGGMREVKSGPRRYEWMYPKEWILKVARGCTPRAGRTEQLFATVVCREGGGCDRRPRVRLVVGKGVWCDFIESSLLMSDEEFWFFVVLGISLIL
ncbi:hypothetical protein Dimus_003317 [Dionaea muscipula]